LSAAIEPREAKNRRKTDSTTNGEFSRNPRRRKRFARRGPGDAICFRPLSENEKEPASGRHYVGWSSTTTGGEQ